MLPHPPLETLPISSYRQLAQHSHISQQSLESELFLLLLHLYFKFCTACFLTSIQNSFLKDYSDDTFSIISHYASSLKKLVKEFSTISPSWKFTWLRQVTTNQESSNKELQKLFLKEWESCWEEKKSRSHAGW